MVNWNPVGGSKRYINGRWVDVTAKKRRDSGAWVAVTSTDRNTDVTPPPPPPTGGPPGLTPGVVRAGWYASPPSLSGNNDMAHASVIMDARNTSTGGSAWWQGSSDAKTLPGGLTHKYPSVTKQFHPGTFISPSALLANLADADAKGYYLCQTTKPPVAPGGRIKDAHNNDVNDYDWKGIAQGNYNSTLAAYAQIALDRKTAGKRGFFLNIHHEPYGDYTTSLSTLPVPTATPEWWAAMQTYCSYYMAGKRGGTPDSAYVAANDTRDNLSWGCIPNGWLFTGGRTQTDALDVLMPASLIDAFNANHGIISPDVYDENTANKRLHDKINAVYNWCVARGVQYAGVTELGTNDATELAATWAALKNHADLFLYVVYWDSGNGHEATGMGDMRLIPNGYPADSLAGGTGPFVGAGTATTQAQLIYWRDTAVVESEAMG